jgi:hypothetical protein
MGKETTIVNEDKARNVEGYYNVNEFRDYTADNNLAIFLKGILKPFSSNINLNKHFSKLRRLVGYWIGVRFKFKNNNLKAITFDSANLSTGGNLITVVSSNENLFANNDCLDITYSGGSKDLFLISSWSYNSTTDTYTLLGRTKQNTISSGIINISKVLPTRLTLLNTYSSVTKNIR